MACFENLILYLPLKKLMFGSFHLAVRRRQLNG